MTTLLMTNQNSVDAQLLWREATRRDWTVVRLRGLQVPQLTDDEIVIYLEALYGEWVAERLNVGLLEPAVDWLPKLPWELRLRDIRISRMDDARMTSGDLFIKPPNDKSFPAAVYRSGVGLPEEYDGAMPVLVAEPVHWEAEFRCFCLDGEVRAMSPYHRDSVEGRLTDYHSTASERANVHAMVVELLETTGSATPRAIVIDVGKIAGRGWAVVEANGAWGAGIYGCAPSPVLDVIRQATTKL